MRLLKFAPELQAFVRDGRLSVGHAKVILGLSSPEEQKIAAERVLKKSLNVRQTEELVACCKTSRRAKNGKRRGPARAPDAHVAAVQDKIQERLAPRWFSVIVRARAPLRSSSSMTTTWNGF